MHQAWDGVLRYQLNKIDPVLFLADNVVGQTH